VKRLNGSLQVRIYPAGYSVDHYSPRDASAEYRSTRLDPRSESLDKNIRDRRGLYARLYHEATALCPEHGYSFDQWLLLLCHYKPIVARQVTALVVSMQARKLMYLHTRNRTKDIISRTNTVKMVTRLVHRDCAESLLKMWLFRRRFQLHLQKRRQQNRTCWELNNPVH
jgi:hypothetical protein